MDYLLLFNVLIMKGIVDWFIVLLYVVVRDRLLKFI